MKTKMLMNEKDIAEAVAHWLTFITGGTVIAGDVSIQIEKVTEGYGMGEHLVDRVVALALVTPQFETHADRVLAGVAHEEVG